MKRICLLATALFAITCATAVAQEVNGDLATLLYEAKVSLIEKKWDRSKELLSQAIAHNGEAHRKPAKLHEISADDVAFGELQVTRMLDDRPAMRGKLEEDHELLSWSARQFAGELSGFRIEWSPNSPVGGAAACFDPPSAVRPASIRIASSVRQGDTKRIQTFEELWSQAVFEFYNASQRKAFRELYEKAFKREISRDEYVESMFRVEWKTMEFTRHFYLNHFFQTAVDLDIRSEPSRWFFHPVTLLSPEAGLKAYDNRTQYPWSIYGAYYDNIVRQAIAAETKSPAE